MSKNAPEAQQGTKSVSSSTQYRLSTIFVLTVIAGVLIAFLEPKGDDLLLAGAVTFAAALVIGAAVGVVRPPMSDRVFWSAVVAAMMLAVASEVVLMDRLGILGWPVTAAVAATFAAGLGNRYWRMIQAALAASIANAIYIAVLNVRGVSCASDSSAVLANLACAAIGGALLAIMIDAIRWAVHRWSLPQPIVGLALVLAAMGFTVAAPSLFPQW